MKRTRRNPWCAMMAALAACGFASPSATLLAQSFRAAGIELEAMRPVVIEAGPLRPVVVVEFLHHGLARPDGKNVLVTAKGKGPVPSRVLQVGPGDFCRVAFQTTPGQAAYEVLYGGDPPEPGRLPAWTHRDGLLLQIRRFKPCDLGRFEEVRKAFDSAEPLGADYVETVHHARNPFTLHQEAFLSLYHGPLYVTQGGDYLFWTSSRDCSFLLIDGKIVVEAPGRHGPLYQAHPGTGKKTHLSAGPHEFDYYHAAAGPETIMVAAWSNSPQDPKPRPILIPGEAFRGGSIGRAEAGPVTTRARKSVPDFQYTIAGDVPLPDEPLPLVGVAFKNTSHAALAAGGKPLWDFGDSQTSDQPAPAHVYLHPGIYRVSLSVKRGTQTVETANRIEVDRPLGGGGREKPHTLDDYLPLLKTYDPSKLDAVALRQLVLAYQAKSRAVEAAAGDKAAAGQDRTAAGQVRAAAGQPEVLAYLAAAVEAGKVPFVGPSAAQGEDELLALAKLVGPIARVDLGDSQTALAVWKGAAQRIRAAKLQAQCQLHAADIALNDLLDDKTAGPLLEAAGAALGAEATGELAVRLHRVRGDYLARQGDGKAAQTAYIEAQRRLDSRRSHLERTAWRGAHSRSTEQFLKAKDWARARAEIDLWQDEFPEEKIDGYLTLLLARYWAGREKHAQAIALSEQLLAVNAASPYADQLLWLSARCELELGRKDRAAATLRSLLKDYPGSPLVPEAQRQLDAMK